MRSALVTVVAGRHAHLLAQRAVLAGAAGADLDLHVVVALGDPAVARVLADDTAHPPVRVVELPADRAALPLAAGRNAGASAARAAGAELLVFLDVDCLAGAELVTRYADAARRRPDALLCGPVTYLTAEQTARAGSDGLATMRAPHPGRPDPAPGTLPPGDHALFWSLSFALTVATWDRTGGFDEGYTGYGAEDTDFGARAAQRGVELLWVGGADAFHQFHVTHSPPAQHVDDILRNGARYARRWGRWPMEGWLDQLAMVGLVRRTADGWRRGDRLRIASVPEHHPYVTAVAPAVVDAAAPGRTSGWAPDPLLTEAGLRAVAADCDLVHLHFGYEHLDAGQLRRWLDVLRELHLPLVLTVHDLRNPHLGDNARHEAQLRSLLGAAAEVITLTAAAAEQIRVQYARTATVAAHPTVLAGVDDPGPGDPDSRRVLVPLGALRANVQEVGALLAAVADGADRAGGAVVVDVRPDRDDDPRVAAARALADAGRIELVVSPRRSDSALARLLAAARVLVLPYRFGTHSGWLELARDLGVRPVVPSTGCYVAQAGCAAEVFTHDEQRGLDAAGLAGAVTRALGQPRPDRAERAARRAERDHVRAAHEIVYRRALRR